jgi:hypothetical protein
MKKIVLFMFLAAFAVPCLGQTHGKKLTNEEAAQKTPDQRYVYETERKAKKKKKKNLSTKQKVRTQEKQEARMRKKKPSKRRN